MMRYLRDAFLIVGVGASLIATADAFQSLGDRSGRAPDGRGSETPVVVNPAASVARACAELAEHLGRDAPEMAPGAGSRRMTGERILPLTCPPTVVDVSDPPPESQHQQRFGAAEPILG